MNEPRPLAAVTAAAVVSGGAASPSAGVSVEQAVMSALYDGLSKLIGSNGLDALVARALRMARASEPTLSEVSAAPGGELAGLVSDPVARERGLALLLAHVFELLMRFIGEDLAMRLIRDVWPDAEPFAK